MIKNHRTEWLATIRIIFTDKIWQDLPGPEFHWLPISDGTKHRDTFRAFKNHEMTDPLKDVGFADITVDVDFDYLKLFTGENTLSYGPVSQADFLTQLGKDYSFNLDTKVASHKMVACLFCLFVWMDAFPKEGSGYPI